MTIEKNKNVLLSRFLDLYWLRPEAALAMTIRAKTVLPHLQGIVSPSIDISGGDGLFSFITCGGEIEPSFDVYKSVGHLDKVNSEKADIYDYFDSNYNPVITSKPQIKFSHNSDWKNNLLEKSKKLDFYDNHICHDNNKPQPFESDYFRFIYSNSIYWIQDIEFFLSEAFRILRPGGTAIFQVKNDMQIDRTFRQISALDFKCKDLLDRGRSDTYLSLATKEVWLERFNSAGFTIESINPVFTKDIRHIVDIGLRPFSPVLVKMVNSLDVNERNERKCEWVDICYDLLDCLAQPESSLGWDTDIAEHMYVLKKPNV